MSLGKVDDSHQCLYTSEILSPLLSANRGMAAGMKTPEIFGQPDANLAHCRYGQTGLARLATVITSIDICLKRVTCIGRRDISVLIIL